MKLTNITGEEMNTLSLCVIMWIICSVVAYGYSFAHYQRTCPGIAEQDYLDDLLFCLHMSVGGPLALLPMICMLEFRGFKFK